MANEAVQAAQLLRYLYLSEGHDLEKVRKRYLGRTSKVDVARLRQVRGVLVALTEAMQRDDADGWGAVERAAQAFEDWLGAPASDGNANPVHVKAASESEPVAARAASEDPPPAPWSTTPPSVEVPPVEPSAAAPSAPTSDSALPYEGAAPGRTRASNKQIAAAVVADKVVLEKPALNQVQTASIAGGHQLAAIASQVSKALAWPVETYAELCNAVDRGDNLETVCESFGVSPAVINAIHKAWRKRLSGDEAMSAKFEQRRKR